MRIPNTQDQQRLFNLVESCNNRTAFTDTTNQFYGKVEEKFFNTSDFYHPDLDKADCQLQNTAKYTLDQVRLTSISKNKYGPKYESILSSGILKPCWMIPDLDPHAKFEGKVLDGITRIVLARTIEKNEKDIKNIEIPMIVISDPEIIRLVLRNKNSFQTLVNNHLPSDPSSREDIKKLIRDFIRAEPNDPNEHSKQFKTQLVDHVHSLCSGHSKRSTVRKYVSEEYNSINQKSRGVRSFSEPEHLKNTIKSALQKGKGKVKISNSNWKDDKKKYTNDKYKIYSGTSTRGGLQKDIGTELLRKAKGEDKRPSLYIFRVDTARSEKSVREAQINVFDQINQLNKLIKTNVFDTVFALGQIIGGDEGKLLTETDIKSAHLKLVKSA